MTKRHQHKRTSEPLEWRPKFTDDSGKQVKRSLKKGERDRRVIAKTEVDGREYTLHATKGQLYT